MAARPRSHLMARPKERFRVAVHTFAHKQQRDAIVPTFVPSTNASFVRNASVTSIQSRGEYPDDSPLLRSAVAAHSQRVLRLAPRILPFRRIVPHRDNHRMSCHSPEVDRKLWSHLARPNRRQCRH